MVRSNSFRASAVISPLTCLLFLFFAIPLIEASLFSAPATDRTILNMNLSWKFYRGDASGASAPSFNDQSWSTVHLPHSFRNLTALSSSVYRGIGWYRKHFTLTSEQSDKRVTLFFEGAMTVAQVWINGTSLETHYGGYNPFCYDITQYCAFDGTDNVVAVRLDNTYQSNVPPEKPDNSGLDYTIFGGLYRDVRLILTNTMYIPEAVHDWSNGFALQGGQFITCPSVSASAATVRVETWIRNRSASAATCRLVTTLVDAQGTPAASDETSGSVSTSGVTKFTQTLTVADPHLWFPYDLPYRYTLNTVVYNGTGAIDHYSTKIGIRQFTWTQTNGFYCNGEPIKILGLNRTQQWPYVGGAVPNIQQVRDAVILKEAGCNFVRCSHYLQDDAFMNACDSLGMMLWIEIPSWASGFTPNLSTHVLWAERCKEAVRTFIRHSRNHPSVAIWGSVNEAWQNVAFDEAIQATMKQEDTTHPTTQSRNYATTNNVFDLYGGNWFTSVPASNPDPGTRGFLLSEHTGHTYPTARADEETRLISHALKHEQMTMWSREKPFIHGILGWCAFDYNSGNGAVVQNHGVMDIMHIPKFCCYFYKSQSAQYNYDGTKDPMVFIENYYAAGSPLDRTVFTNCEQVKLSRNGSPVGTQSPDKAGNACAHPPVTFSNVAFQSGSLKAEGLIGGQVVATHTVRTPGTVSGIVLTADPDTIVANGSDFSRVVAALVDADNTVVPTARNSITFTVSGNGAAIGQNPVAAIAGYHIILAQADLTPGTIRVSASAGSASSNQVTIVTLPLRQETPIAAPATLSKRFCATRKSVLVHGTTLCLPPSFADQLHSPVAVYDLRGACVYRGTITSRRIDLAKEKKAGIKSYIVRIGGTR
ncbi:MAG: DUF4982 domain-containing protein [Chitinispirillaceae bacterium]|nr:DUF4982 domain-containing protein [Chitinispirillaceae bacterium]